MMSPAGMHALRSLPRAYLPGLHPRHCFKVLCANIRLVARSSTVSRTADLHMSCDRAAWALRDVHACDVWSNVGGVSDQACG